MIPAAVELLETGDLPELEDVLVAEQQILLALELLEGEPGRTPEQKGHVRFELETLLELVRYLRGRKAN